ncbi:MAG: tetratricopeptide repeat protein [Candidatus Methanoperedens sp.]|nr:tetratricopeptide repeat protein [Candidatus Methanoperedens sp.]
MILGKKKTVLDIPPKEAELSKGNGSDNNGSNAAKENSDACVWGNKGNALVESSMYAEAIKCYDKAIEINPGSMEAWNNKGLALARTGRLAEAIQCYDKALELNPGDMEVMYNKGIALALLGKPAEAIECYDKLLAVNPGDADAWCSRGDVLFESGRFEEALTDYDKSIAIDPKDETAWNNRGMTLVKLNRLVEAVESYDKALELNPKVEKIWSNKGIAIAKLGENNNKIDLRKVAASLPKEDIPASQATETQPALPLKEETVQAPVPVEPAERANTVPADISAVAGNAPLNNQIGTNEAKAPPEIPHQVQADIQSDTDMPEPPVEKAASINEIPGQETIKQADKEPENGVSIASAGSINNDTVSDAGKTDPCAPVLTGVTGVPAAGMPAPGQAEIKPDKQKSEPEVFIEKAESIANDKLADIEKYLLSLPVDKTGGAGNADTGMTAPLIEIKAAPAADMLKSHVEGAVEGACQNPEPLNEITTPPAISSPLPEQADMSSAGQELKHELSADKAVSDSIDRAANAGKCIVSVPVDAYITAPFIDKHLHGQAEADTGGQKIKTPEEYLIMGNTMYSQGKYEGAVDSYNKSLHIEPGNNTAWNNKGLALGRTGKLDEAIDCYDKALGLNPDDHIVLNNKGSALYKKGNIEGALQCYRSALELKPDSKTAKKGIKICTASINKSRKTKGRE